MSSEEKEGRTLKSLRRAVKEIAPYSGLGLQLVVTVVIFWFVGKLIDDHYGTAPLWMIVGAVIGIIVGMYNFIKVAIEIGRKKSDED